MLFNSNNCEKIDMKKEIVRKLVNQMKQRKNTKIIPTDNEKNASNVCQQLETSFASFQSANPKPDSVEFIQFIRDFEVFLKEETNDKLIKYFSPPIIQNITIHVCSNEFNSDLIHHLFHLYNLILSKAGVIFSAISYMTLFLFLSNGDEERFNILKNERISIDIFSDEFFFNDFISESLFNLTFQKLFLTVSSKEICQFYTNLIFKVSPLNFLSNYDYKTILDYLHQQKPNEKIYPEVAIFLSGLFSVNDKYKFYFNDKGNFEFLSELLFNAPFDSIIKCFTYLIFIDPPNYSLLTNIVDFYKKNSHIQAQFFDIGIKLIQLHPEIAIEINSIVPFSDWLTSQISISKLVFLIKLMNSINNSLVSQFLNFYFSLLLKESELDYYIFGIDIIESQIFHHRINLNFLLNSLFLNVYINQPSTDILSEIFKKSNNFAQIVYDLYSIPKEESIQHQILDKIIQVGMKNSELIPIVSGFLSISGTPENLKEIMKLIEDSKNGNFCETLSFSFIKSDVFSQNFLREYGLKWIDSIFNEKIIDIQMFKKLIMGLTQRLSNQSIDDYIESLPKNHPLFSLEEKDILSLIYGFESPHTYFPIKVYSLFHLIPCPTKIDPYNATIIGRNRVYKKYENYMNLPFIKDIGNRYMTDDLFYSFLNNPTNLEQFTDNAYDHFPLFQVFEYTYEKVFDMKFNSISFWFRFDSKIDESLKIPFFHASKFNLFYKNNNLIAVYEGSDYVIPINPLKWNHIFVSISPRALMHKIKIFVNLNKAVFTSPTKLLEFEDFGFLVYATYLYIGPAIRIYENKTKERNKIFELGPSSMIKLNENHLIVPSSDFLADKSMLSVPYYGFPEHFKSEKKLNYFFEILKKTNDESEFDKFLSLYFKIYLVLKNSNNNLFSSLLSFFASDPIKLTKERFYNVLNFFGSNKNRSILIDEILQNKLFWENVSNDLIIFSLVSYFKTFDFYESFDKLQFFLSSRIIYNQKNKYLITSYLKNFKELPKSQRCLMRLFQCHHYMYQKQNKEIQCQIHISNSQKNPINETKEEQENDDQYLSIINKRNISIQCECEVNDENLSDFDEEFLLFHNINNTELQFNIIECLYDFLKIPENFESIKTILPIEDLLSIFIVSQNNFKASLFKIFVLIEKNSPGTFLINNTFLVAFFPLFTYQNIWDEVMSLITDDGKTIKNTSMIVLILALIWSLTAASLHSVLQTGKPIQLSFKKEIEFCLSNVKIIASNKTAQHFIRIWSPLLLGFVNNKNDNSIPLIKVESFEIKPPKVSDFVHYIWKTIIEEARKIDSNLPMKTDKFNLKEFKTFIPNSDLIIFLINIILSTPKDQFIHIFTPILCIPMISKKEISETFIPQFVTSCLTVLSQTFKLEYLFIPFTPILYYMSSCGLMKFNFNLILSIIFAIVTLLHDLYLNTYKKALPVINNLMIHIFSNCDNETLPVLFNVLQQNVQIFNEIIKSTNSIDIYLSFFQKVAPNCYKEFDFFFQIFLKVSKIDQKNKKVDELINHVENHDNSSMNKWNKTLNSLSSITKMVKNEKQLFFSSLMSELLMNTKEFTKTFFITQKKQIQYSEHLKKIFNSTENIQNSQVYFDYSIQKRYESMNHLITITTQMNQINTKQIKLLPFAFPDSIPHLFVPTPIQSQKEAIEFITENKLYSKEIKLISNASMNQKLNVITENSNEDSQKVSKSIFKKKDKKIVEIKTQNDDDLNQTNEKKRQSKRRKSMFTSSNSLNLLLNPLVFNCQLKRFNYSIPTSFTLKSNNLELIPFCNNNFSTESSSFYPSGNFPLHPEFVSKFVMDVINGFWGMTSIIDSRIVIKIPLNSILAIHKISSKSYQFWTMKNGTFILDNLECDILEKKPFKDMNLFTSNEAIQNKNKVVSKWIEGSLSTSQMIVLLNLCEGKSYVDQNNFIQFPESLSVFGTFLPINESLHSNLIEGKMSGSEEFSNSIEYKDNFDSIVEFIKKFNISYPIECLNRPSSSFSIDSHIFCQKISGTVTSFSLFDNNSIIQDLPPLSVRISDTYPFYIVVDRNKATVYSIDLKANRKTFIENSVNFTIARSISVSKKFMFLAIDMENNDSYIYRILYEKAIPSKLEFIQKKQFLYDQKTAVNDSELLAATFSEKTVYIWPFYRFEYHRIINFEKKIRFLQFDDISGTFWVCDGYSCFLFDLNGKMFSNYKFEKKISAFAVVPQPFYECRRSAICGFIDGSIEFISTQIESAELFVKELKKCHQSKIERITFNPQNNYFLTIDNCQNAFLWTKKDVGENAEIFDINIFESCPLCRKKPCKFCTSCKRAFCDDCMKNSQICPECSL